MEYARGMKLHTCKYCQKRLRRKRYPNGCLEAVTKFLNRKYCDRSCMAKAFIKEDATYSAIGRRARKFVGKVCERCGLSNAQHRKAYDANLVVHHINRNPKDNAPDNLQTLCFRCHRIVHIKLNGETVNKDCRICGHKAVSKGLCRMHYERFKLYGDPLLTKVAIGQSKFEIRRVDAEYSQRPRAAIDAAMNPETRDESE